MLLKHLLLAMSVLSATLYPVNGVSLSERDAVPQLVRWLFHTGDDPAWKRYRLDERQWQRIEVPGSWQSQGFDSASGLGWYRTHIHIDAGDPAGNLAIMLGRISDADQAFLNGVPIGAEGRIGAQAVEADSKTRVYRIPPGAIRRGGDNVLAVRVMNTRRAAGIVAGPLGFGSYGMLNMEADGLDSSIKVFQGLVTGLLLVMVLFSCFLYLNGLHARTNLYFGLFLIAITVSTFLDSLYFYDLGLKTPLIQRVIYALNAAAPIVLLLFVVRVVGGRLQIWEKAVAVLVAVIAVLFLLPPAGLERLIPIVRVDQMDLIGVAWLGMLILWPFMVVRGLIAAWYGFKGGVMIAIAAALPLTVSLLDRRFQLLPGGVDPFLVGIVLMILLFLFAVAGRYFDMTQRLQALTRDLTTVQAMERQRLSRDLHDSLGQNLVSFQLNLKMAAEQIGHPLLTSMLADVSSSIRRLDDTLQDLRPTELAHHSLCTALERHCRRVQDTSGLRIRVQTDCPEPLSEQVKENLFSIAQEALNNCVKHARASRIRLRAVIRGSRLELKIIDNGRGFDLKSLPDRGLGMLTMRERAQLIGARFNVHSEPGRGTAVHVEVPLYD